MEKISSLKNITKAIFYTLLALLCVTVMAKRHFDRIEYNSNPNIPQNNMIQFAL